MSASKFDVVVVGAGAAGLTAAVGLARAGFTVGVVEAAAFPGAENWSGCVYFCENLAHPDILGPDGVEALAWERRLVERGFFATDGHGLLGMKYRDPAAFRHCYTVLRPIYDHHLAQVAVRHGVALLTATTAESLIRDSGTVIGICTNRGPLYGDLVFLAEGDASHLVTREGYERYTDPHEAPKFLQGIKEVLELPPGAIESRFGVAAEEGVAYEMLLRNGTLRGRSVHLNMGGFLYTNRRSLSVGLVLPADNLREHFDGDPNLLLQWFEGLPALRPWLEEGRRSAFGAKIIRGGGARDIPTLIDDGLAIGGAASAIGIDFPYPNFTGPATAMGLLLAQAAGRIRAEGARFTRDALRRHYLEPLQRTSYWRDVEFLRRWPGYVKKTRAFFGRNLDVALGSAYTWTRPGRWLPARLTGWLRLLRGLVGPQEWPELREDARQLAHALRLEQVAVVPSLGQILLDGTLNALRDLLRQPRADLPPAGTIRMYYTVAGGADPAGLPPRALRRWFARFAPVLATAAHRVYANDGEPLESKLPAALRVIVKQINLLDVLAAAGLGLVAGLSTAVSLGWGRLRRLLGRRSAGPEQPPALSGPYADYAQAAQRATDLTPAVAAATQEWEARLARLGYEPVKESHIHLLWPQELATKDAVIKAGLWHVCPAHVYEARTGPGGAVQVIVNFENCIKCETCWRTSDLVDWGRDGRHRFIYAVHSPAVTRLLAEQDAAGLVQPALPRALGPWDGETEALRASQAKAFNGRPADAVAEVARLLVCLDRKLAEFDAALDEEPRTIDRARAEHLQMLARYAQNVAARIVDVLRGVEAEAVEPVWQQLSALATAAASKAAEYTRQALAQRFSWAAATGRQLRQHDLVGLRRLLGPVAPVQDTARQHWLRAEDAAERLADRRADWQRRLDAVFAPSAWRDLDTGSPLTPEQDGVLLKLLSEVPAVVPAEPHPAERKLLLAELARRDPSLAYRAACHLWARDLAGLAGEAAAERWRRGEEWACFAFLDGQEAFFVPALGAAACFLLNSQQAKMFVRRPGDGLRIEPLATLGLRGAGLARLVLDDEAGGEGVEPERLVRAYEILSSADLVAIAFGMTDLLCRRAVEQAMGRVQFPGLFHDEEARDAISKFGAVKKMVAEIAARRYLLSTLDHTLSPPDLSRETARSARLVKALAAEALGTAPGSVSYNAGQVFGGTAYSEDDILSKYYRDAAAWRFLAALNPLVWANHGSRLLHLWGKPDDPLSTLPGEADLFDEAAQRKALQGQLDALRVQRSRVRALVGEFLASRERERPEDVTPVAHAPGSPRDAEVGDALARQDAYMLATKALLLRTHARLERGLLSETELALLCVWQESATASLEDFEEAVRRALSSAVPPALPDTGPPVTVYAEFLASPAPYDSGDFLVKPADPLQPRYVPEMVETDPRLAAYDRELLTAHFGAPRDGLIYERYLERQHRPDDADLEFLRRHGFFRIPIPKELGGEGRPKVEYYLLTTNTHRLADVAISLTIQVNSSLGTTPVLLPREKDLPKAQKDMAAFTADTALHGDIRDRLQKLLALFGSGDGRLPAATAGLIDAAYRGLQKRLEESVLSRPVLRVLASRFLLAWQAAGKAGRAHDFDAMRVQLQEALTAWQDACGRAAVMLDEIGRRRRAADLFLRWVAAGQISAFALTEPSAGSDTARVATRARLQSVSVEREPDGVLHFVPAGGKEPRYLLDAARLEFRTDPGDAGPRAFYRWCDAAEPAPIRFDEYDYETDNPHRMRYYDRGARRVHFTDIAQLRERDGKVWYDYWELNGAKMWITNGRMCGIMCLYAKTEEGVTGFIVDRHAEGLVVGKDEAKMGQCGSPTNELSLQGVRVPRENVIGLEGRGQVNALETLNVGRAGLAMSAMAQMQYLCEWSHAFAEGQNPSPQPPPRSGEGEKNYSPPLRFGEGVGGRGFLADWRLARMEEDRFTAEALAHEVVGRFEHKQTKSVRLESAVAKMLVSELFHRVIETAEEIHGLAGQTQLHLVEKRKRDARVLNIYEGTNEIQRFFILRDLAGELVPRWGVTAPPAGTERETLELEEAKGELRQRALAAVETFGGQLAQNPNLQANCFLLAEAVAWVAAANSTLGRLAFVRRLGLPSQAVGARAFARCLSEIRTRLKRFDDELLRLRRGLYAPAVRAATLLFHEAARPQPVVAPRSRITRPLSVLVVLGPTVPGVPKPHVEEGRLLEPYRVLTDADRAALETALRLRDQAEAPITVQVATVGPAAVVPLLREIVSLGVDRVRLILTPVEVVAADRAAAALAAALRAESFDLILTGAAESTLGILTAEALAVPFAGSAAQLAVRAAGSGDSLLLTAADGGQRRTRALPAAVAVEAGTTLRAFTVDGYLAGLSRAVEVAPWPAEVEAIPVTFTEASHVAAAAGEAAPRPLLPTEAGLLVLESIGVHASGADGAPGALDDTAVTVPVTETNEPFFFEERAARRAVVAVLAAEGDGRLRPTASRSLDAARFVAQFVDGGADTAVLLLVPRAEEAQRRAVAELGRLGPADVCLLAADCEDASDALRSRLLVECCAARAQFPAALVGEPWTESAFATLATRSGRVDSIALRVGSLDREQGRLVAETPFHAHLRTRRVLDPVAGRTCWVSLIAEAEVGALSPPQKGRPWRVERWSPHLERFYGRGDVRRLLEELKEAAGVLRLGDAEFIIDVGFGVGNRDGYEAVIEPLERALRALGVRGLMIGGSRKVTEELHLLPADRQIGQSGVSVNPRVLLAIGVSGAPQHLNYIGPRATVVAFNRDAEAPLVTLNQRQARPRVFPVIGDLFETVPALTEALRHHRETP